MHLPLSRFLAAFIGATSLGTWSLAQDQHIAGNLTVAGVADIEGNALSVGTTPTSQPAVTTTYLPPTLGGQAHLVNFAATPSDTLWRWLADGTVQLTLGGTTPTLTLFSTTGAESVRLRAGAPSVFQSGLETHGAITAHAGLNLPNTAIININGAILYRDSSGALRTDSRFSTSSDIRSTGPVEAGGFGAFRGRVIVNPTDPTSTDFFQLRNVTLENFSSEMRIIISDNAVDHFEADRLSVGATDWRNDSWHPRFTVMASGNVGVGTSAPAVPLQVSPGPFTQSSELLRLSSPGPVQRIASHAGDPAQLRSYIEFRRLSDTGNDNAVSIASHPSAPIFHVRGDKVGIGTDAPENRLDVQGTTRLRGNLTLPETTGLFGPRVAIHGSVHVTDGELRLVRSTSTDPFRIVNVDEGNYNSEVRLIVGDNALQSNETDRLSIGATDYVTGDWYPRLTVMSKGRVGVGTSSPTAHFEVVGDAKISGGLTVAGQPVVTADQLADFQPSDGSNLTSVPASAITASGTRSSTTFLRGDNTWAEPPSSGGTGGSGVTDGNKGDITVSASGSQWTVNDGLPLSRLATNPLDRANHTGAQDWSTISNAPTTAAGYGLTDVVVVEPSGAVALQGDVTIRNQAVLRVSPAGDIGMGAFTAGPNPSL